MNIIIVEDMKKYKKVVFSGRFLMARERAGRKKRIRDKRKYIKVVL